MDVPNFAELPVRDGAPAGSSWGVFGDNDEIGTLNFIGPEQVAAAAKLVTTGHVFPLNWDLSLPSPAFFKRRSITHTVIERREGFVIDDYLDSFWPQASSQWDGLRHIADEQGHYNGVGFPEALDPGSGRLGVEHWAQRGIAGRGVLVDIVAQLEAEGIELDPFDFFPIRPDLIERTLNQARIRLMTGDILVFRTGWVEAYERLSGEEREAYAATERPGSPGLHGDDIPPFLWDNRVAAVAADNPALEAGRPRKGSDLSLHRALIPRLGMPLGELWDVAALARDCQQDGVFEFFLTSAPLRLNGGVGTPPNVLALK